MMRNCEKIKTDNCTYRWIYTDTVTELRDILNDYDLYVGRLIDRDTVGMLIVTYEQHTFKDKYARLD
jgi:hypothetical protein